MTKKEIRIKALSCKNINEFKLKYKKAYEESIVMGIFEEMTKHMHNRQRKLTNDDIFFIAKEFKTRTDFYKNDPGAYTSANERGILDDVCQHMLKKLHHNVKKEDVHTLALKYKTRMEFKNSEDGWAYNQAVKKKYIDEVCSHMETIGSKYYRCVYVYEFTKQKSCYVGLTYSIHLRHLQHNNSKTYSAVREFCEKNNIEMVSPIQLTDYIEKNEASKMEKYYVEKYKDEGWNILNRQTAGSLGGNREHITYTKELCKKLADECSSKTEFSKKYVSAYRYTHLYGWCDFVFKDLNKKLKINRKNINGRKVLQYDKKYNFIKEFPSIAEASRVTKISKSAIKNSCRNKNKILYLTNYIFRYKGEEIDEKFIKDLETRKANRYKINSKRVIMMDIEGNVIKMFNNAKDAGIFVNRAERTIRDVCVHKRKCAGYYWSYEEIK